MLTELGFHKVAVEDDRPYPGFFARQMAASRAMRRGDSGWRQMVADDELIGKRYSHSLGYGLQGAGIGAVPGALVGAGFGAANKNIGKGAVLGAIIGAALGGATGSHYGNYKADKKYLDARGIDMSWWGNIRNMTPEAQRRYLHKKYKGGGFE